MARRMVLVLAVVLGFLTVPLTTAQAGVGSFGWSGSWATAVQAPTAGFEPNWALDGFTNQTLRQVVRVSDGGPSVWIRLSNVYGTAPLRVTGATVARAEAGAAVRPGSVRG